jgi:hypothetical protein
MMPRATADEWRAIDPEILSGNREAEEKIEQIAWLMDRSIPIGGMRIGLDPILGLVPGIGDALSTLISSLIIVQAHRAGVPKPTILRMVANVGIDTAVGAIPVVGDLFDFAWKANSKNLELFRGSVRGHRRASRDWGFLAIVFAVLALLLAVPVVLAVWALRAIF